jgi:hypothetical protein
MSVAQIVAEERARLARERAAGGQAENAASKAGEPDSAISDCDPEILPEDIAPEPEQVGAVRAQASTGGKRSKGDLGSKTRDVICDLDFLIDQHGRLMYAYTTPTGRREFVDAEFSAALDAVALRVAEATGTVPSHEVLKRELAPIRARARQQGNKIYIHNRTASDGFGGYIIDIGNKAGDVVHINALGWCVESNHDVAFRRGAAYGELLLPDSQKTPLEAWASLTDWLVAKGVKANTVPSVIVMVCDWFRPDTPSPLAEIIAGPGAGKTTLATSLVSLIDPTTSGGLASTGINEEDVTAGASNRLVLAYDNAGGPLSDDAQDLLCKVATGTVLATRRLYTQGDEFAVQVLAPFIITAIVPVITRADARSRTVRVTLSKRGSFEGASDIEAKFKAIRPELTGALLTLLAAGLARLPEARGRTYTHRLVDFEQLGEAITSAVGWQAGQFQESMRKHRRDVAEETADATPIVVAVRKLVAELGAKAQPGTSPPIGSGRTVMHYAYVDLQSTLHVGVMLKELHIRCSAAGGGGMYRNERSTRNALEIHAPTLAALGITYGVAKCRAGQLVEFRANV